MMRIVTWLVMIVAMGSARADDSGWSPVVDGLRGRLVVTATVDAAKRPQLAIALELDNASDSAAPITLAAGAPSQMVKLVLEDEAGKAIAHGAIAGNELIGPPYVLALPVHSTLRTTLSPAAYEYVPSGRTMLRPFALVAWDVPAKHGKLYLRATFAPVASKDVRGKWNGSLALPRVALP
jgi:hypothetical protein